MLPQPGPARTPPATAKRRDREMREMVPCAGVRGDTYTADLERSPVAIPSPAVRPCSQGQDPNRCRDVALCRTDLERGSRSAGIRTSVIGQAESCSGSAQEVGEKGYPVEGRNAQTEACERGVSREARELRDKTRSLTGRSAR